MKFLDCLKRFLLHERQYTKKVSRQEQIFPGLHSPGLCQSSYLSFVPMSSFTCCGAGTEAPGDQPDLSSNPADLMASLLTPQSTLCCCYYHQFQPWFAKHFYFASCLNAFPFRHDSQIANRCFQLCPCLFCFLFNGLFSR